MEIATNAVIAALLVQSSAFVKDIGAPIQTPMVQSNIEIFRWARGWNRDGEELTCYFRYRGGYEFRHEKGRIQSFDTPDAYTELQDIHDLERLSGEAHHTQDECLARAREVIHKLGYTNVALINRQPSIEMPAPGIPRCIFHWLQEGSNGREATVEINSSNLAVEDIKLGGIPFWRTPWPLTFGMTNTVTVQPVQTPSRTELAVRDVSQEYANAFIRAIIPEVSDFCSKLGPPIPTKIEEADINRGESEVTIKKGRVTASLRLKSGYLVVYHAGHVWAVHAVDAYYTSPNRNPKVRQSPEWNDPMQFSKEQVSEKIKRVAIDKLGFPEKELFLDTEPFFTLSPKADMTNSVRRFVFHWHKPETEEERRRGQKTDPYADISLSAEIDAVSGNIKALNCLGKWFERADPKIDLPIIPMKTSDEKIEPPVNDH
jgi:hypothetical protein